MEDKINEQNISLYKIYQDKNIYQFDNGFKYSVDIILLSKFVETELDKKSKILEIGSGSGILSVLLSENKNILSYDAVEIQKNNCELFKKNMEINNFNFKINIFNEDIKNFKNNNFYDIVISNPPFMEIDGRKINENDHKKISRHEINLNLEEFISSSKKFLKPIGKLIFVHRMHRMIEILKLLDKYNFCVSKIRYVKKENTYQNIILIEAYKGKKQILKIDDIYI